jgi:phosphoglycerate dehydrogenase-like enzyme
MKVVLASNHLGAEYPARLQAEFPDVDFAYALTHEGQLEAARHADVFFGWPDAAIFEAASNLQWIACPGTGVDKIVEIPAIRDSDIPLTNAPGAHVPPMADHVLGMVIALAHNFRELYRDQDQRVFDAHNWDGRMEELGGRQLGIFGYGELGRAIADRAVAFNMDVKAVDPNPGAETGAASEIWGLDRLDELVTSSDWLVIAAPYIPATHHVIDAVRIRAMKRGSRIIVISRGGIVDEDALADAIADGHLAGAGLDATEIEPLPKGSTLWDQENMIITQHASALTPELYEGRRLVFIDNLRRFVNDEPLQHICDKSAGY